MEADQNLTTSDAVDGIRPKCKRGLSVDNNDPCPNKMRADKCTNLIAQNVKHSERNAQTGSSVSENQSGMQSNVKPNDSCAEHALLGNSKSCNGGTSPLGSDKCDNNAAEEKCLASGYGDSKNAREGMPKMEDDNGLVKREMESLEDMQKCASPSRDLIKTESKDKEDQSDNSRTVDGELSKSGVKTETKPADVNDSAEMNNTDKTSEEDRSSPDDTQLQRQSGETVAQSTECSAENLSKTSEGCVYASADINLPLDMTVASTERRLTPAGSQKSVKSEGKLKSDSLRPVGRLLHDLGLDLVRQQVYKDLISIQVAKDSKNMLDEKEKEQLKRLTDAHAKLLVKNATYQLPFATCRCGYSSSSANVLALHHEFGSTYEVPFHACCMCENFKTRWPSQFLSHMDSLHDKKGRVQTKMAVNVCKYCPYEHKNQMRMEVHVAKCFKKFNLNTNLQPLPADCDVPLLGKTSQAGNSQQVRPGVLGGPLSFPSPQPAHSSHQVPKQIVASSAPASIQPSVMEIGGQLYSLVHHNGKALFTSLRSQMSNSSSSSTAPCAGMPPGNFPRFVQPPPGRRVTKDRGSGGTASTSPNQRREKCEMCDAMVNDREALWIHFRMMHKVELSKVSMIEKEPWMMCDVCMAKFWTYQGLARHSMQLHKRELAPPAMPTKSFKCFLCLQVQTNPLNHLSTYHNITLLDMYHSRRCCMCNRRFRAAPAFEEHMVLQHHDIFANKDVLCTVLQALSTALSLKRQETIQQRATPSASTKSNQRSNSGQIPASTGQGWSVAISAPSSTQKSIQETPSSSSKIQPDARKRGHKSQPGEHAKESEQAAASKSTPKKSNEEDAKELNKLYKEYADIGRPILRSMRHRLAQGGAEKAENSSPTEESKSKQLEKVGEDSTVSTNDNTRAEMDSVTRLESDEPCAKKRCLESLQNNVEMNDSESTGHREQLQEINNRDMTSLTDCQKAS